MDHSAFIQEHNLTSDQFAYMCRTTDPLCKCGKYKRVIPSSQSAVGVKFFHYCGAKECNPRYGIKRPMHSVKMKKLVNEGSEAYKNTLMKKGEKFNTKVNTPEFRKKRLDNHNIQYDDSNFEVKFSELVSSLQKSISTRRKKIVLSYNRWEDEYKQLILIVTNGVEPTTDWAQNLSDDEVDIIWRRIHGIATIRNQGKVKSIRPGFFKRVHMSGFKHNSKNQTSVVTKSGLEARWIEFFEERQIPWCYEPVVIPTIKNDGFHIPDFVIVVNGRTYLLEAKGSFYRQEINDYFSNKVEAAKAFARSNNMSYVLTQKQPSLEFEDALVYME